MRLLHRSTLGVLAFALVAGACSDSTAPAFQPTDLATALSEMSVSSAVPASLGISVPSATLVPSACAYTASSQSFVCAPLTTNGLTFSRSFILLNASNSPQSAFDPATTAAVRSLSTVNGTMTMNGMSMTIDEQSDMTLSGLLTGPHTLDGTMVMHMTTSGTTGTPVTETVSMAIAGLVPPEHGSTKPYPRAGSITITMPDPILGSSAAFTMTMVFNGTSMADVTMSGGGMTQHCTMDLTGGTGGTCFR